MTPKQISTMVQSGGLRMRKQAQLYLKKYFPDKNIIAYYETENTYYFVIKKNSKRVLLYECYISNPSVGETSAENARIYEKDINYLRAIKDIQNKGVIFERDVWELFLSELLLEVI